MNFKQLLENMFSYTPKDSYQFDLSETSQKIEPQFEKENTPKKIFPSLSVNLEYMKTKYKILINSDVILREFTMNARGKQYNAFIVYIDGMVDSKIMDDFILKPLMLRNRNNLYDGSQNKVISEAVANNITVRKVKKFDLPNYLMGCLLPQNDVKEIETFEEAASRYQFTEIAFYLLIL